MATSYPEYKGLYNGPCKISSLALQTSPTTSSQQFPLSELSLYYHLLTGSLALFFWPKQTLTLKQVISESPRTGSYSAFRRPQSTDFELLLLLCLHNDYCFLVQLLTGKIMLHSLKSRSTDSFLCEPDKESSMLES